MEAPVIAAILLAAGQSRRMGSVNKLRLDIAGVPMLRHATNTLLASQVSTVLVVTGHEADWANRTLEDLPVGTVNNPHFAAGQAGSVRLGLNEMSVECDAILMCLADQPALTAADINAVIDAFVQQQTRPILVPHYQGARGNPTILASYLRQDILNRSDHPGCRRFMNDNPHLVNFWEAPNDHFISDIDTAEAYTSFIGQQLKNAQ